MDIEGLGQKASDFFEQLFWHRVGRQHRMNNAARNRVFDAQGIADLLPYDRWDADKELLINRDSLAFILQLQPQMGANESGIVGFESLISQQIPCGADAQVLLCASPKVGPQLEAYKAMRANSSPLCQALARYRAAYLKSGVFSPLVRSSPSVIRDFRLFFVLSMPKGCHVADRLVDARRRIESDLSASSIGFARLDVGGFLQLMDTLLNPAESVTPASGRYDPAAPLTEHLREGIGHELVVSRSKLTFRYSHSTEHPKGTPDRVVRAFSVRRFPNRVAQSGLNDLIGRLEKHGAQIPCAFVTSFHFRVRPPGIEGAKTAIKTAQKEKDAGSAGSKFVPSMNNEAEEYAWLQHETGCGRRVVDGCYQVFLFSSPEALSDAESRLLGLYREGGFTLLADDGVQLGTYLSLLPCQMSEGRFFKTLKAIGKFRTMTAFNAANLAPLQGGFSGRNTQPINVYVSRRGQLAFDDVFHQGESTTNMNRVLIAASGSGKSAKAQDTIQGVLSQGGLCRIIDSGRSYKKFCEANGGTLIEFVPGKPVCVNPFSQVGIISEEMPLLKALVGLMVVGDDEKIELARGDMSYIEQAILACWADRGPETTVTAIAQWLEAQGKPQCAVLANDLRPFTRHGSYAPFFEGKNTLDLSAQLVLLELEDLKSDPLLEKFVLMSLMATINGQLYLGNRDRKKLIVLDEAWALFGEKGAGKFIENGYRTARRYNASFLVISQGIKEFFETDAGKAAWSQSATKILFAQTEDCWNEAKKKEWLGMDAFTEQLYKGLRTRKGEYSEFAVVTNDGPQVFRLILDPFSLVLFSSKAADFEAVEQLQRQGLPIEQAVARVAEAHYPEAWARLMAASESNQLRR